MKYTSLSARVWEGQMDILKKAARKEKYISVADYVRDRIMPVAAKDAGVELPEFPSLSKRGRKTTHTIAAEAMGLPLDDWRKQVLDSVAAAAIKQLGSGAAQPHPKRSKTG